MVGDEFGAVGQLETDAAFEGDTGAAVHELAGAGDRKARGTRRRFPPDALIAFLGG
jgi:hypothetical protein